MTAPLSCHYWAACAQPAAVELVRMCVHEHRDATPSCAKHAPELREAFQRGLHGESCETCWGYPDRLPHEPARPQDHKCPLPYVGEAKL